MSEYVVGVDEVGRGSLVGSTIICAFRSQNSLFDKLPFSVSDSKKINKKKREEIYNYFKLNKGFNYNYQIIVGKKKFIEKFNIHNVVLQCMKQSIILLSKKTDTVIIDGKFIPNGMEDYKVKALVKADDKINQVSAASIIAKVYRDKLITKLHLKDNVYQWNKNAGYGTKNHLDAIYSHGVSKFHRTTYQPISRLIKKLST